MTEQYRVVRREEHGPWESVPGFESVPIQEAQEFMLAVYPYSVRTDELLDGNGVRKMYFFNTETHEPGPSMYFAYERIQANT